MHTFNRRRTMCGTLDYLPPEMGMHISISISQCSIKLMPLWPMYRACLWDEFINKLLAVKYIYQYNDLSKELMNIYCLAELLAVKYINNWLQTLTMWNCQFQWRAWSMMPMWISGALVSFAMNFFMEFLLLKQRNTQTHIEGKKQCYPRTV